MRLSLIRLTEKPFINSVGIQYLSKSIHKTLFPKHLREAVTESKELQSFSYEQLSHTHLRRHNLLGKTTAINDPISFKLPKLQGNSLDEHFSRIALQDSYPYKDMALSFAEAPIPLMPPESSYILQSGWTCYPISSRKAPYKVGYPNDDCLVFDTEVLYKISPYPVIATAVSSKAWYVWLSPFITDDSEDIKQLIPLGTHSKEKIIIGHNIGYDRSKILDEYSLKQSKAFFIDTMSLHSAANGMCSRQRPMWMSYKSTSKKVKDEEDLRNNNNENNGNENEHNNIIRKNKLKTLADIRGSAKTEGLQSLLSNPVLDEFSSRIFSTSSNNTLDNNLSDSGNELQLDIKDNPWMTKSSLNNLADVAKLHCGINLSKEIRNQFDTIDPTTIKNNLPQLITYCATDVQTTYRVYQKILPLYLKTCPHPISFSALRHISTSFLPINKSYENYVISSESKYLEMKQKIENELQRLTYLYLDLKDHPEIYNKDPWLKQLDWTIKPIKYTKPTKLNPIPRLVKNQKLPGKPKWFKELCKTDSKLEITVRSRITALLLKLSWEGKPVVWCDGWCIRVPSSQVKDYIDRNYELLKPVNNDGYNPDFFSNDEGMLFGIPHKDGKGKRCVNLMAKNYLQAFEKGILKSEVDSKDPTLKIKELDNIDNDTTTKNISGSAAVEMNVACSYWIATRERISSQMRVWNKDFDMGYENPYIKKVSKKKNLKVLKNDINNEKEEKQQQQQQQQQQQHLNHGLKHDDFGMILPMVVPMGTITRRAVEKTWLTASNAKKNRIGSELKAMVQAPPPYVFIGADVDSEELWIASLVGDSVFKLHGSTAMGWMTLEGNKKEATDLHSKTAGILGISRNNAKVFNYGRIYGAGLKFATQLLKQFNPTLTDEQATKVCQDLYDATKGLQGRSKLLHPPKNLEGKLKLQKFWYSGTESITFNKLEEIAEQESPRTPVLGAGITSALKRKNLNTSNFMTSRVNWAIQSSGVDYLHLLIVSMSYLIKRFNLDARLSITVHDEIRYMVHEKDKWKAILALQVSNLWTRAMFCEQLGIYDVPQSCAFFSQVDVDWVLRKEVDLDCITMSNETPIKPGKAYSINDLMDKINENEDEVILKEDSLNNKNIQNMDQLIAGFEYIPRKSVFEEIEEEACKTNDSKLAFTRAQIAESREEVKLIEKELRIVAKTNNNNTTLRKRKPTVSKPSTFKNNKSMTKNNKDVISKSKEQDTKQFIDQESEIFEDINWFGNEILPPHPVTFEDNNNNWFDSNIPPTDDFWLNVDPRMNIIENQV